MNKNIMKRFFAIALVIVLSLGTSALAACNATVTASSLNVRAGVGTGYKVLQALTRDTQVYYLGVSDVDSSGNVWYKVQYGAHGTGWVSANYCSLTGNVLTSYCTANSGNTYIRTNPNLEGSKLGVMHQGETAYYLGQVMADERGVDWFYVNFNGTYGWVSTMYTYLHSESTNGLNFMPSLPTYGSTRGTLTAEGGDAYIRSEASLYGSELAVLHEGDAATYLDERSVDNRGVVWFKVNYNGKTGWISSKYAMLYGNAPTYTTPSFAKKYVKATGGQTNLRTTPSLDGKSIDVVQQGETALYLNEQAMDYRGVVWYKVQYDGETGWVSSKYTTLTNSAGSSTSVTRYVESSANSNVRAQPNLNGKVLETMHEGDVATYTGSTSYDDRGVAWYSIKFDGVNGWVSSKYTDLY